MSRYYHKRTIKGSGRRWEITLAVSDLAKDSKPSNQHHITFFTDEVTKAKQIFLTEVQKVLRRYKKPEQKCFLTYVFPESLDPTVEKGTLSGNEQLRFKERFCKSVKVFLRLRNPEIAIVQGYGEKALDALET
jgi:hypothetical protein